MIFASNCTHLQSVSVHPSTEYSIDTRPSLRILFREAQKEWRIFPKAEKSLKGSLINFWSHSPIPSPAKVICWCPEWMRTQTIKKGIAQGYDGVQSVKFGVAFAYGAMCTSRSRISRFSWRGMAHVRMNVHVSARTADPRIGCMPSPNKVVARCLDHTQVGKHDYNANKIITSYSSLWRIV